MSRLRTLLPAVLALSVALAFSAPAQDADKPARPFNGVDLSGWRFRGDRAKSQWVVGHVSLDKKDPAKLDVRPTKGGEAPELINQGRSVDIYTDERFSDCTVELECMVPKGSNSGIYLMGEYEVQILDSYGKKKVGPGDLGGIYQTSAPKVNAAKKPGEWQKFVIEFRAPRFKDGKKVENAKFLKVTLNGQVIQEDVEVKGPTTAALKGKEAPAGPLMFQGDHGPVAFRNIKIAAHPGK